MMGLLTGNQFGFPSSPMEAAGFTNITRIPMVTLRLPLKINMAQHVMSLEDSSAQPQWGLLKIKSLFRKSLQIIHNNIEYYLLCWPKYQTINIARLAMPYNFTNLPMTISIIESSNTYPVNDRSKIYLK